MTEIQRARPLLGTLVVVRVSHGCKAAGQAAASAAFAALAEVQSALSFHDPRSELSRLNREAHRVPVVVGEHTAAVLRMALELAAASDGAFDPCVGGRLVQTGHLPRPVATPTPDGAATFRDIQIDAADRVRLARPLWLDFGGIAKGYAVDRAIDVLQSSGAHAGVVNAGGDLRVFGARAEAIALRLPQAPYRAVPALSLQNRALATSGGYFSLRESEGPVTALIHPRTRAPLGINRSVSVIAPTCAVADALTKVVMGEPDLAPTMLARYGAEAIAFGMESLIEAAS
jgi:thiamine biosynthesis lipoprotein